jgi:hypothetical protein
VAEEHVDGFRDGSALGRLLRHRALGVSEVSIMAGIQESELLAVIDAEETPGFQFLLRLSSVLGLHVADLFVMTGVQVPEELSPLDSEAGGLVPSLVQSAVRLSLSSRKRLLDLVRSLPQCERTRPLPEPKDYERYPSGFGGILVRMLETRNLKWVSSAKVLYILGGSPPMSAHVIGALGQGRREITPRLVADFSAVLGISEGDLAAVGEMVIPEGQFPVSPAAADSAMLIWETRRLTREQVRHLSDQVASMRQE